MTNISRALASLVCLVFLATGCGKAGVDDTPDADVMGSGFSQTGRASYYGVGDGFHGRRTANGEIFNAYGFTAAHKTLRLGTCLSVTNLDNGKKTKVRVNDRGPYAGGRILDLSYGAAKAIGMVSSGTAQVRIEGVSCSTTASL
ncbi:MAG: rare lipoA family protein [Pseudomonadota bacterium]